MGPCHTERGTATLPVSLLSFGKYSAQAFRQSTVAVPRQTQRGMAKKLGEVIRDLRKRAKISQSTLSRQAGLSPTILSRLEAGQRAGMQFESLCRIAQALEISLDEIASEAGLLPARGRARGKPPTRLRYNEDVRQVQGLLARASEKMEDLKGGPDTKRQRS